MAGGHPTSAVVSFRSQKTKASHDYDQGKQLFMNQFDMNLYNKMVDMLPRVVQAIEDTIFEDEPSWQVSLQKTKCDTKDILHTNFFFNHPFPIHRNTKTF